MKILPLFCKNLLQIMIAFIMVNLIKKNDTLLFKIPQKINDLEDTYIYNTERGTLKSLKTKKTTYREILID